MPIRIQYGDTGDLGALAIQSGEGQAFQQRAAMEQAIISQVRERQLAQQRMQFDALKANQTARLTGTPTSASRVRVTQPFPVTPEQNQQSLFQQAGIEPREQAVFKLAQQAGDKNTLSRVLGRTSEGDPMSSAKQAYINSIAQAAGLPPAEVEALNAYAQSEDVDLSQLRIAANQASTRSRAAAPPTVSPTSVYNQQAQLQRDQVNRLRREQAELERTLAELGGDASGAPSQFNPDVRDVGGPVSEGFRNLGDVFRSGTPYGDVSSGGNPQGMAAYTRLQQIKQQLAAAEQEQQKLVNQPQYQVVPGSIETGRAQQQDALQGWSIEEIE